MNKVVKLLGLFLVIGSGAPVVGSETSDALDLSQPEVRDAFGTGLAPMVQPTAVGKSAKLSQGDRKRGDAQARSEGGLLGGAAACLAAVGDISQYDVRDGQKKLASAQQATDIVEAQPEMCVKCEKPAIDVNIRYESTGTAMITHRAFYCAACFPKQNLPKQNSPWISNTTWRRLKWCGGIALGAWLLYNNRNEISSGCNTLWCQLGLGRTAIPA